MVHHFIVKLLNACIPEKTVREEVWDSLLLDQLRASYKQAMDHARFLLEAERENTLITLNHYFSDNLDKAQSTRKARALVDLATECHDGKRWLSLELLESLTTHKSNEQQAREAIHDTLQSYYKVARKRFVDNIYQQSIILFLLNGKRGPLKILSPKMVAELNETQLELIAGEDSLTRETRNRLKQETKQYEAAMRILRS